ncbi:hypothetical protein HK103_000417 [Boothiomyces macroporosus]|uniref:Cupin type-2 domain-containing protein n=1 Tax=Boothiomyces macroporosus TaxID=261099 RepID=A0AAD5Y5L2_9FUNG|nr:hypothetical protein HK103_000417 [Boothiomyces macroporosus]
MTENEQPHTVVACKDKATFDQLFDWITGHSQLSFRVKVIYPADYPTTALVVGHGLALKLVIEKSNTNLSFELFGIEDAVLTSPFDIITFTLNSKPYHPIFTPPPTKSEYVFTKASDEATAGRAGMMYRDLIPSRLGGAVIASHITIPNGGPVPDYTHYHDIRFQLIYCYKGSVELVYEDQGEPFIMQAGDCVLQPPLIRHQVLNVGNEGLQVIEVGGPACHATFGDLEMNLPNGFNPSRTFGTQRFTHHQDARAPWCDAGGVVVKDSGLYEASKVVGLRKLKINSKLFCNHNGEMLFLYVLDGFIEIQSKEFDQKLHVDDCCAIPRNTDFVLEGSAYLLEVTLPGNLDWFNKQLQ